MDSNQLLQQIKKDLENEDLKDILARVKQALKPGSAFENDCIKLMRRYNSHSKTFMDGRLSYADYQVEMTRLTDSVLNFVGQLGAEDIVSGTSVRLSRIMNPILVVCFSEKDKEDMRLFFKLLDFAHVSVNLEEEIKPTDLSQYELIIFDNHDLPDARNKDLSDAQKQALDIRSTLMQKYLETSNEYYIIHFGEFLPFVSMHRERVHAANSKFTLFARIKEALEFKERYLLS